jgi:hypothetical protein
VTRGIVYVGGANRHLIDQSGALLADRIARSLQNNIKDSQPFSFRVRVSVDAHRLAPDIGLDIASIEVKKGDAWEPAIDILEVKYLARFTKRFVELPALARALRACWLVIRSAGVSLRRAIGPTAASPGPPPTPAGRLDRAQAVWLYIVRLAIIGAVGYWFVVGAIAVLGVPSVFDVSLKDILQSFPPDNPKKVSSASAAILAALVLLLGRTLRKTVIEPVEQSAAETFAALEYQLDDRHQVATPNAILDAIDFAADKGYAAVDLLSFSLGALLAIDAVFPRKASQRAALPQRVKIENCITIGYPYDLIRSSFGDYFTQRQPAAVPFGRWVNLVVRDDFLGTAFSDGDRRGIFVLGSSDPVRPDVNLELSNPPGRVEPGPLDRIVPGRRTINHQIYWDDENPRAMTCFELLVHEASIGWAKAVAPQSR